MRLRAPTELLHVLRDLGADPVNMPMGEVYSALAKGVIDGVVAPTDTFKSLHFAEVAQLLRDARDSARRVPGAGDGHRGAGQRCLPSSAPCSRRRSRSGRRRSPSENRRALERRAALAGRRAIGFHADRSAADQRAFDALYLRDAERNAAALERYGIDGRDVFARARASIGADGTVRL